MLDELDTATASRFVFFSQLQGKRVRSAEGHDLGRLTDLVVIPGELYPPVDALVVRSWGRSRLRLLWTSVAGFDSHVIQLLSGAVAEPLSDVCPPDRLRLAEEILDRQIVDVEGAKLERVNDLQFVEVKGLLRLAHVDVGFRGLVRRMGWEKFADGAVRRLTPWSPYLKSDALLSWKLIQPLGEASGRMRLDAAQAQLAELHPADLAEIMEELNRAERMTLFSRLDTETAADALEEVSPEVSTQLINDVSPELAADILEEMEPDEAADVLGELPTETRSELLDAMDLPEAADVQELLRYDPRSAGGLMTTDLVRFDQSLSAGAALAAIRSSDNQVPRVYEVFIVDAAGVLRGQVTLKSLVMAHPELTLAELMHESPASVSVDAALRELAELTAKYKVFALPVVDPDGTLIGMVTVDDILPAVLDAA